MSTAPAFASVTEAMDMARAALGYLAAADAASLAAQTQAECLRGLEQTDAISTAARARFLAAFTAGQGYSEDADYSARAWLMHRTGITRGAAASHTAWAKRAGTHPRVVAALAAEELSESYGRVICQWTDKLPEKYREESDELLVTAAAAGLELRDLGALFAEMYERARGDLPDEDPARGFADRGVRLATTFQGAGVMTGDLTPECATVVGAVLEALSAPAGAEDARTQEQRYHDALQEAMRRLVAAGLLPERAGQPVKVWAHMSLADLLRLDGSSALQEEWTAQVRAQWAAHRAAASETGSDGGAWLDGDAAAAIACDAAMAPIVTGDVNAAALEDLVRLCVELDWHRRADADARTGDEPGAPARTPASPGRRSSRRSSARPSTCCRAPAAWPASCAAGSSAPASAAPACRWTSATPRPSRPGSATRSSCGTSTASGPGGATSPPPPARCTTSSTRPTAGRRPSRTACCSAFFTTRSSSTSGAGPWSSTPTGPPPPGTRTGPRCCTATDRPSGRGDPPGYRGVSS